MNLDRRSVIRSAGALGTTLLAPNLPMWAHADEAPAYPAPSDYIGASSALIHVDADVLVPTSIQDGISLADVYYGLCSSAVRKGTSSLLEAYRRMVGNGTDSQDVADSLLRSQSDPSKPSAADFSTAARLTMMMWLFGVWYGKTETDAISPAGTYIEPRYQVDFVVSARAYTNGWIWRFAQAHPMGSSHFKFGSWADAPPPLASYVNPTG